MSGIACQHDGQKKLRTNTVSERSGRRHDLYHIVNTKWVHVFINNPLCEAFELCVSPSMRSYNERTLAFLDQDNSLAGVFFSVLASDEQSDQFHGMRSEEVPSLPWKQKPIVDCRFSKGT